MKSKSLCLCAAIVLISFASCKKDVKQPDSTYNPVISPANFAKSTNFTNPYFPVATGKKYIYEGETSEGLEHIEEQRLSSTKTILGITCIEVEFKAFLDGELIEKALDWYAQDNDGTVWYFGEAVDNYDENGVLQDHEGSWEAGVDGAKPGTIMPANPQVGMKYREEYYLNHAEDEAEVTGTGLTVTTPLGTYTNCIKTKNFTRLEPDLNENKFYAPGIGLVMEENVAEKTEISLIAIQ